MGLLVLTRMKDQSISITVPPSLHPTEITVMVTDLRVEVNPYTDDKKRKVRLGFQAPRDVQIDRAEVRRRKDAESVRVGSQRQAVGAGKERVTP